MRGADDSPDLKDLDEIAEFCGDFLPGVHGPGDFPADS
jgi:hypothetical protein